MTSTDLLVAGVIAALLAPAARLHETKAAFGVVIVCVAFATTIEVIIATTVAMRMTPGRENFWIRILIAFILFGFSFLLVCFGPALTSRPGKSFLAVQPCTAGNPGKGEAEKSQPRIADSSSRKSGHLFIRTHNETLSVGNDSVHGNRSKIMTRRTPGSGQFQRSR